MKKKRCPICNKVLKADQDICPNDGSYVEEPTYDAEADLDDEG